MQSNTENKDYTQLSDEISIRQFVNLAIVYFRLILKRWYFIVFGFLLLGGYKYHEIAQVKPSFPAKVKILIQPQDNAKENKHSVKVFAQLANSPNLLTNVLLEEVEEGDSTNLLINTYLNTYFKMKPEELDANIPIGFQMKHNKIDQASSEERMVLNKVLGKLGTPMADFTDGFVSISVDDEMGFVTINLSSPTEALSLLMLDRIYGHVKVLLNNSHTFADQKAYSNFQKDSDSLSTHYKESYYKLNRLKDKRERELKKEKSNPREVRYLEKKIHKLEVVAEVYKVEYLASVEQLKGAQMDRDKNSLLIHELEHTLAPIVPYAPSPKLVGIKFGIFGAALAIMLVLFTRIYSNLSLELSGGDD